MESSKQFPPSCGPARSSPRSINSRNETAEESECVLDRCLPSRGVADQFDSSIKDAISPEDTATASSADCKHHLHVELAQQSLGCGAYSPAAFMYNEKVAPSSTNVMTPQKTRVKTALKGGRYVSSAMDIVNKGVTKKTPMSSPIRFRAAVNRPHSQSARNFCAMLPRCLTGLTCRTKLSAATRWRIFEADLPIIVANAMHATSIIVLVMTVT
jgi:hypothetical protein